MGVVYLLLDFIGVVYLLLDYEWRSKNAAISRCAYALCICPLLFRLKRVAAAEVASCKTINESTKHKPKMEDSLFSLFIVDCHGESCCCSWPM